MIAHLPTFPANAVTFHELEGIRPSIYRKQLTKDPDVLPEQPTSPSVDDLINSIYRGPKDPYDVFAENSTEMNGLLMLRQLTPNFFHDHSNSSFSSRCAISSFAQPLTQFYS